MSSSSSQTPRDSRILWYSLFLGAVFVIHAISIVSWTSVSPLSSSSALFYYFVDILPHHPAWCVYLALLSWFHLSEYYVTLWYQPPGRATAASFLLNHSTAYHIAVTVGVAEYWIESTWFPTLKGFMLPTSFYSSLANAAATTATATGSTAPGEADTQQDTWGFRFYYWYTGLILCCICGQILRTTAMATAGGNFSHMIADDHKETHVLVKHGVYSVFRHPAYVGWFWWSIGTQIVLGNPFCIVFYAFASWKFFADRIPYEEYTLLGFFGTEYSRYASRTYMGIPCIQSPARNAQIVIAAEQ